jgi:hypothetical protein
MKKSNKVLLGIATMWPLVYMALFMVFVLSTIFVMRGGTTAEGTFPIAMTIVFALHFLTIIWIWALIAFYMVNVFKNHRVDQDKKALWAVVLFMGNVFAMPVYWYLYIWPEDGAPSRASNAPGALNDAEGYNWAAEAASKRREKDYVPPSQPPNWRD